MLNEVKTNYVNVITRYADFKGRASRKEFWLFVSVNLILQIALNTAIMSLWSLAAINLSIVSSLFALATLVPSIAVAVRRLHDIDRSGWWELLGFVPVVGPLTLMGFYCIPGSEEENRFGSRPKAIGVDPELSPEKAERDLERALNTLKQACVDSIATEKQTESELQKATKAHETWANRAAMAVDRNDDDLARQCLAKKLESNLAIQALSAQLQTQKETSTSLKARYTEMQQQLGVFRARKSELYARSQAASAREMSNPGSSAGTTSAMDRFEDKLRAKEALNEANREMAAAGRSTAVSEFSGVEDELAELKRTLSNKDD